MWIFTKQGYFSIACGRDYDDMLDPKTKMLRCRCSQQLEALKADYPDILHGKKVQFTYETDYSYRIILRQEELNLLLFEIADNIDYSNFKQEALCTNPGDFQFIKLLHQVWEWWYLLKGGFVQKPHKKKKRKADEYVKKFGKRKNGKRRRKAKSPQPVIQAGASGNKRKRNRKTKKKKTE